MLLMYCIPILLSISLVFSQNEGKDEWKLIKHSDEIKVYIKEESKNSDYVNIRATTESEGSLEAFATIMHDVPNYKNWMHSVEETYIVEEESNYHFSYYMLTNFPWPTKDRDVVLNMKFEWLPEEETFITHSKEKEGLVSEKNNIVRIQKVNASYSFTRQRNNNIRIEYKGKINPGVQLPDWIMEKVYHIAPYNTLKNLRQIVQKYQDKDTNFNFDEI
ncbi:MAG: START domain-containing protein [Bacteroidales bacterium]